MILIGLGANLSGIYGSPEECLQACPALLARHGIQITGSSHIWKSAPVPISDQPWYHNAVCVIKTQHNAHDVLNVLARVEHEAGRERLGVNAARVLDLDLLCYEDEIIEGDHLQIPHPRMHERAFVLYPLQEIAPQWSHPIMNKSVDECVRDMPKGQKIEMIAGSSVLTHKMGQ